MDEGIAAVGKGEVLDGDDFFVVVVQDYDRHIYRELRVDFQRVLLPRQEERGRRVLYLQAERLLCPRVRKVKLAAATLDLGAFRQAVHEIAE